jgi:hypothetical protein
MEISNLLLSGSRALWGVITPNVRKVSIEEKNNIITLHFYYNEEPSEMESELSEDAASEVIADFPEPFLIDCQRYTISYPKKINFAGYLIYARYEE